MSGPVDLPDGAPSRRYRQEPSRNAVDLIHDGVPPRDLREGGDRAVWNTLVRTAASYAQRGVECWEWQTYLAKPTSRLGAQARARRGTKPRSAAETQKLLDAAWDTATAWLSEQDEPYAPGAGGAKRSALERAAALAEVVAYPGGPLSDADRRVLAYAAAYAEQRGTDLATLPRREVMAATGLGERTVRNALERLVAAGLLVLRHPGRPSGPGARRRSSAAQYQLPRVEDARAYLYRETRYVGPPDHVGGTPTVESPGTPRHVGGTPSSSPANTPALPSVAQSQEDAPVVTLTLSATTPERLVEVLELLNRQAGATVVAPAGVPPQEAHTAAPDNVRPLRRAGRVS